jgi:LysR family nitrogen assimilation transcriptional regulator
MCWHTGWPHLTIMDLKQLEYFVRVAELGSFTRASMSLDVAQPALSRQVRLLEVELRQNLLTRNGRGATLTEAGKLLLEHGRGILHQVQIARAALSSSRAARWRGASRWACRPACRGSSPCR